MRIPGVFDYQLTNLSDPHPVTLFMCPLRKAGLWGQKSQAFTGRRGAQVAFTRSIQASDGAPTGSARDLDEEEETRWPDSEDA